jgi:hypothetical protein
MSNTWVRFGGALALGLTALGIIGGSIAASLLVGPSQERAPLAAGSAAIGVVFFLGVLMLGNTGDQPFTLDAVRHAITAGFVTTYFTLLGFSAWYSGKTGTSFAPNLMSTFTDLLKIILPFYFVTEAGVQFQKTRLAARERANSPPAPDEPAAGDPQT